MNLADQFATTARHMAAVSTPERIGNDWYLVSEYLRTAADVIVAFAPPVDRCEPGHLESSTPSVMEFAQLAEIASTSGAARLRDAGTNVGQVAAVLAQPNPLSQEQAELLRLLVDGRTLFQAGQTLGYSTRTVQRKLTSIQAVLGVASRPEAIAVVVANGWLHSSPTDPTIGTRD